MGEALGLHLSCGRALDDVVHHRCDPQAAVTRRVNEPGPYTLRRMFFLEQGRLEHCRHPGITVGGGELFVRHQLGLHHHPDRAVESLDVVTDRRDRALHEGHQPGRGHPHGLTGGRGPLASAQHAGTKVEAPLMATQLAVADVERLVIDEEADDLAIGHVDHRLARLGVPVAGLGVRQRPQLVDAVQIGTGQAVGLSPASRCARWPARRATRSARAPPTSDRSPAGTTARR